MPVFIFDLIKLFALSIFVVIFNINIKKTTDSVAKVDTATGTSGAPTIEFTQNNYSPKSLSSTDIYRQTKNQFTAIERMLET